MFQDRLKTTRRRDTGTTTSATTTSSRSTALLRKRTLVVISFAALVAAASTAFAPLPAQAHSKRRAHKAAQTYRSRRVQEQSRVTLGRDGKTLMSRGAGFDAPAQTPITGRLGVVNKDNVSIYASREDYGRLLFTVSNGQQVIVTGETDQYYAVAMQNRSLGFIAKSSVDLQNVQITATGTSPIDGAQTQVSASQTGLPLVQGLLQSANHYLGITPYVWGGNTIDGIDCSGFVKAVYSENGITLPRTAADQAKVGYDVPLRDLSQWAPGDRMYFMCHHDYIDHTGMYVGNGYFIHSSINHHGVDYDRVDTPYYWQHLVCVRRSGEMVAAIQQAGTATSAPDTESSQE